MWIVTRIYNLLLGMDRKLDRLLQQQGTEMATITDIKARVIQKTSVVQGTVTLLNELSTELRAALASGDPAAIQAILDQLDVNDKALADAVVANTRAAPTA